MPRSMTGYGRGECAMAGVHVTIEARSVNHRFCEVVSRLPRALMVLEDRIRKTVTQYIARGRVELSVSMELVDGRQKTVKVNLPLAHDYLAALNALRSELGLDEPVRLSDITSLPDVLTFEENIADPEEAWVLVSSALCSCMESLQAMRQKEGENLAADIAGRVEKIACLLNDIERRAPAVVEEYREKISRRLAELLPPGTIDEQRLTMEVVLVAERSNITEEIVRAKSHLSQVAASLKSEGAIGRKIEFLLQEINREITTISSKSPDLSIAEAVVIIKGELEKIREQIQNLE